MSLKQFEEKTEEQNCLLWCKVCWQSLPKHQKEISFPFENLEINDNVDSNFETPAHELKSFNISQTEEVNLINDEWGQKVEMKMW